MGKMVKSLSVLLSLILFLSLINVPELKVKASGTVDDFVERCYTVTLDRGSDPDGFADWKDQLLNGKAVGVHVAYGFLFSAEYTGKNKSNEDYVRDLYMLFMGREPDEAGFNDWVGQLKSGKSRKEVFAGFANSQEFFNICDSYGISAGRFELSYDRNKVNNVNLFVQRLYKICLGRNGDIGGQKNWVQKLLSKQITGIEAARSFIFSQEYTNLNLSDADYVENLYLAMMGRASDEGGKNNWLYGLKNGMTRDEVFAGFANSAEFDNICKTYGIDKGSYTATNKGNFNKDNPSNVPVNNDNNNNTENDQNDKPSFKVGDIVKFGKYEQDGNTSNGAEDIEWRVLSVEDSRILVISEYALDVKPYNTEVAEVTWETCTLRSWLNNDFYNSAFSTNEKNEIPSVTLVNKDNSRYGTPGGNNTTDKVFCLSLEEMEKYFGDYNWYDSERQYGYNQNLICAPTQYVIDTRNVHYKVIDLYDWTFIFSYYGYTYDVVGRCGCFWLLRSPGQFSGFPCQVSNEGGAGAGNSVTVDNTWYPIRPAMYIEY